MIENRSQWEFYAWIYKGKILSEIILPSNFKGDKREREIEKRIRKEKRLENETKSKFWYYKLKELTFHRMLFQSMEKKQFAEDVRTAYKWYILPFLNTLSEIRDKFNFQESFLEAFKLTKDFNNSENLPKYSIYIRIHFKLKKPYLSKDDDSFYIIDNPIVKEKVFKLPMVRATTWKGALRFAALKVFEEGVKNNKNKSNSKIKIDINKDNWKEKRALLVRLFGNEKDAIEKYLNEIIAAEIKGDKSKAGEVEKEFERYLLENGYISKEIPSRAGRLFFYPTFFDQISLDVITPLSRETKTPVRRRGPIYFETVPENTEGIFRLLYYPFDLVAKGEFGKIEKEINEDIEFLSEAMKKMFYEIGFSAKKSSGFGVIENVENGHITVNGYNISKVKEMISNTYG